MTPGSQWPCISMATLPVASRPEALVGPVWAGVDRKPLLNGLAAMSFCRSSPALTKHGSEKSRLFTASWSTSCGHSRSAK